MSKLRDEDVVTSPASSLPGGDADQGDRASTRVDPAGGDPAGGDPAGGDADQGDSDDTTVDSSDSR